MFNFGKAKRAVGDLMQPKPQSKALTLDTPVQFDPTLVERLVTEQGELNARFAALVGRIHNDPLAGRAVRVYANQLHQLRRTEALWLYPVIARGVLRDPVARRQFLQLRLVMLGLARRVLRCFDELARAIRRGTEVPAAADQVTKALTEYRQRNEADIYPLYTRVGTQRIAATSRVA